MLANKTLLHAKRCSSAPERSFYKSALWQSLGSTIWRKPSVWHAHARNPVAKMLLPKSHDSLTRIVIASCSHEEYDSQWKSLPQRLQAISSWELTQLMAVIWCFTLPLGYGGIETISRILGQDAANLSALQKAGFAGANEGLQLVLVLAWLRSRQPGCILLSNISRSLKRCEVATIFQGLSGAVLAVLLVALLGLILLGSSSDDGTARDIVFGTDRLASTTMLVSTLLLAPLLEEIVYRAVLLEGLSAKLPKLPSVSLSAAAFAASHFSASDFLPLTVLGTCLGATYKAREPSLVRSFIAHAVYNLVALQVVAS